MVLTEIIRIMFSSDYKTIQMNYSSAALTIKGIRRDLFMPALPSAAGYKGQPK
jgi:hypothetical protein